MDFTRFKEKLMPLYKSRDPATRWDHAERVASKARTYGAVVAKEGQDVDLDLVEALSYLVTVRNTVLPQMATRTSLEAALVEQGWTSIKAKELFRSLERLPDHPKSVEEELAADAECVTRLGLVGLLRQVAMSAASNASITEALEQAHKQLGRRLFTSPAIAEAGPLKDELRHLITSARHALER